jgi:urea carboxylase
MDNSVPIYSLPGPYDTSEFITAEGRDKFFDSIWKVAFNSGRGGIRLEGPAPEWSRKSGGEGGSHPSNVLGYGYPCGGMSFTGDSAVVFMNDASVQSGFISLQTVLSCELWKLGQRKPGDEVRFVQCSWEQANALEKRTATLLDLIDSAIQQEQSLPAADLDLHIANPIPSLTILHERYASASANGLPRFVIRQAGSKALLCDFGSQEFDMTSRARVEHIVQSISAGSRAGFQTVTRPHTMSVLVTFEPGVIDQKSATDYLVQLESSTPDVADFKIEGKTVRLPMVFDPKENEKANERYMQTQRPYATYLPDNIDFIRRNNALESREEVKQSFQNLSFIILSNSGFMGTPIMIQVDPRKRLLAPKANPSRTVTPAGALGTGGNTTAIYPVQR